MDNLCTLLWGAVTAAAVGASWVVSWLLDNVPEFAAWWKNLSSGVKQIIYAAITLSLGLGAYAAGHYGLDCADWPDFLEIVYILLMAAAGWFTGKARHERMRRGEAEAALKAREE